MSRSFHHALEAYKIRALSENDRMELEAAKASAAPAPPRTPSMPVTSPRPRSKLLGDGRAPSRAFGGGTAIVVKPPVR